VKISVIVSTYNEPAWLEKVLWGYAGQTRRDFQMVVADDGSGAETAEVVERARAAFGGRLLHVWHEDAGYRKCEILNRAVVASSGDYLVFSDGDCLPRADFVAVHAGLAKPGRFLSGGALRLPMGTSRRIGEEDVRSGRAFRAGWLARNEWEPARHRVRLLPNTPLAAALDSLTSTRASWNGGNASTWRDVVLRVNGYDNTMKYGGQDRALGERLENMGVRGIQVRHRAVLLHLEHARPYRTDESIRRNREIRDEIHRTRSARTPDGIAELGDDPGLRIDGAPAR
jgi:glycosyltransferase involved in cell wall biosynthesis